MENDPKAQPGQPENPEEVKARIEKMRAETEVLRTPFYKTSSFYVSIVPVALGILGLIFTWASGWFDVQRTRIENQKTLLQIDTTNLQARAKEQEDRVTSLETNLQALRVERAGLTNQIGLLTKERDEMRGLKDYFEGEAKRLAGSKTNAVKLFKELQAAQADRKQIAFEADQLRATNQLLGKWVARKRDQLRRLDPVGFQAVNLSIDRKVSPKQYADVVYELAKWYTLSRSYSDLVPNSALSDPDALPPGWRVDPDPTNSVKINLK